MTLKKAERMESKVDDEGKEYTFISGNVRLEKDSLTIFCDEASVYKSLEGNHALLFGNVEIRDGGDLTFEAGEGTYFSDTKEIILNDQVTVNFSGGSLTSEGIAYDRANKTIRFLKPTSLSENERETRRYMDGEYDIDTKKIR